MKYWVVPTNVCPTKVGIYIAGRGGDRHIAVASGCCESDVEMDLLIKTYQCSTCRDRITSTARALREGWGKKVYISDSTSFDHPDFLAWLSAWTGWKEKDIEVSIE